MPVRDPLHRLTLGEGGTPLLWGRRLGQALGLGRLWLKDESQNPTGSFKARGLAIAVSRAKELGARAVALPSAGNAAAAMSAYAARAGLPAHVFMPEDTPAAMLAECQAYGAHVVLVRGLIDDCGTVVRAGTQLFGWMDVSTLREPYRAEGKKSMGLELAEQLGWRLPDAIVYPTGGGTGIVGMWKAFEELERLGLIGRERPRMIVVQAEGCAPIVRAFRAGARHADRWTEVRTLAPGIRVPVTIGDYLILDAVRASQGTALTVSDEEMVEGGRLLARLEGLFVSPEAGATVAAARRLRESGDLGTDDEVVLFLTGSGLKHLELVAGDYPVVDPDDPSLPERLAVAVGTMG
jgi:threonine synthase